jgi:outer membrane protein OmpA-like peptidoglycan-associated protein
MIRLFLAAALVLVVATPAFANPCGFEERGRMVVTGYAVGATAVPADQKEKLAKFAETAKTRDGVCITAQVDAQGSDEANKKVANKRAAAVQKFLLSKGVPAEAIKISQQEKGFTLFGLLPSDQQNDRRVKVTFN